MIVMFLHHKNIRFNDLFYKTDNNKHVAFTSTNKNDVTRQAKFVGDSYSSKTTSFKYATVHIACFKPIWEMRRASAKLI